MIIKKYYLQTLGCSKNDVDSEAIEVDLLSAGLQSADSPDDADLLILNSCGFILDAKIESIDAILNMHKNRKNGSVLVMCGCLPARYDMKNDIGEVDLFLSSNEHDKLVPHLQGLGWEVKSDSIIQPVKRKVSGDSFAYLKISEGCNNRCAFYIRDRTIGASIITSF
jgi:ribosomal protein S12 methylthiotransferase